MNEKWYYINKSLNAFQLNYYAKQTRFKLNPNFGRLRHRFRLAEPSRTPPNKYTNTTLFRSVDFGTGFG